MCVLFDVLIVTVSTKGNKSNNMYFKKLTYSILNTFEQNGWVKPYYAIVIYNLLLSLLGSSMFCLKICFLECHLLSVCCSLGKCQYVYWFI